MINMSDIANSPTSNDESIISIILAGVAFVSPLVAQFVGIKHSKFMGYVVGILVGVAVQVAVLLAWIKYMVWKLNKQEGLVDPVNEFLGNTSQLLWLITSVSILSVLVSTYAFYVYMGKKPSLGLGVVGFVVGPLVWWGSTLLSLEISKQISNKFITN